MFPYFLEFPTIPFTFERAFRILNQKNDFYYGLEPFKFCFIFCLVFYFFYEVIFKILSYKKNKLYFICVLLLFSFSVTIGKVAVDLPDVSIVQRRRDGLEMLVHEIREILVGELPLLYLHSEYRRQSVFVDHLIENEVAEARGEYPVLLLQHPLDAVGVVAVHDIGAVGYFAPCDILDLAGLVSPEVIPIIRDEAALMALMEARDAAYLMTFPGWYPRMVTDPRVQLIYQTDGAAPAAGGEHMAVYRLVWDGE